MRGLKAIWMLGLVFLLGLPVQAQEEYTYTIRIYSGMQGSALNGDELIVEKTVRAGEPVSDYFDMNNVRLDNEKYYVKGFKESGKDNATSVQPLPAIADRDMDYVVVYGVKGNGTTYRVNYMDQEGNTLVDSVEYFGNVGDRPVVAFRYIEGYQPQAYNLVRTLSSNAADNEFTFVYTPVVTTQTTTPSTNEEEPAQTTPQATPSQTTTPQTTPEEETQTQTLPANEQTTTPGGDEGQQEQTTPTPPQEIIDLDDPDVPLAGPENSDNGQQTKKSTVSWPWIVGLGALALVLIGGLVYFLIQKKKKEEEERNKPDDDNDNRNLPVVPKA